LNVLEIHTLEIKTQIGVHAWEKKIKQRLSLDLRIGVPDFTLEDTLTNVLDYATFCRALTLYVESTTFNLIETLAEAIARWMTEKYALTHFTLRVSKPDAVPAAKQISVLLQRGNLS